jgi:hypothetical protein
MGQSDGPVFFEGTGYNAECRAGWCPPREDDDRDCHFRALAFLGAAALSIPLTVSEIIWPVLERNGLFAFHWRLCNNAQCRSAIETALASFAPVFQAVLERL